MLSAPDRRVVERDPALPGLAVLLDPEAAAALLARLYPEAEVAVVEATYLRYKPTTSCLAGYRVRLADGGETLAYARASRLDAPDKVHKATQRTALPSALGAGVRIEASRGLTVYPFPHDHELNVLAHLADDKHRRRLLRSLVPDRRDLWRGRVLPLRYKPERRFVGGLHTGGDRTEAPVALVKFYAGSEPEGSAAIYALRSDPALHLPRVLGRSRQHRACALEWLDGRPLDELLAEDPHPAGAFHAAGAALARLHRLDCALERRVDGRAIASSLLATAENLVSVQPELAGRAGRLVARLERLLSGAASPRPVTLHGDFSPDQVLVRSEGVALIDLDRAARGEPAVDLAWFRASLLGAVAVGDLDRSRARGAFEALLDGYLAHGAPVDRDRLALLTGAALLRRAVEPFRLRSPRWPEVNQALLAEAEAMAGDRIEAEAAR